LFAIFAHTDAAAECVSADAYNFRSLSDYVLFVRAIYTTGNGDVKRDEFYPQYIAS
jgi:hypothetical protein